MPQSAGAQFACIAQASAGSFTVPAEVLLALPQSQIQDAMPMGALIVGNYTNPVKLTATTLKLVSYK